MKSTGIIEIFKSFQGEGLYIGKKQLFIRFAGCNLNCSYCDTPKRTSAFCIIHHNDKTQKIKNPVNIEIINGYIKKNISDFDMISFTGNEPLLNYEFIKELCISNKKIKTFLETNSTLTGELKEIINYIDIISADYKWESQPQKFKKFIGIGIENNKEIYIKIVVNNNFLDKEIEKFLNLGITEKVPIIIQPQTNNTTLKIEVTLNNLENIHRKIKKNFMDVRVIPQSHRFINLK